MRRPIVTMALTLAVVTTMLPYLIVPAMRAADLQPAKNEPNLEKRSRLALANAAYAVQNMKATESKLGEVRESVELAQAALIASGKKPGKSPGPYKYAETKSRELLRRLEGLKQEMDLADRAVIEPVQNRVQEIHDAWLDGILTHAK